MLRTGRAQSCGVWRSPRREALSPEHKGPCGAHEPTSPREAVGICGRAPEEDGPGHCGEHTGFGVRGRRPCQADPGAAGVLGAWRPGGGRHSRPCRSSRSRGSTGASPSGPGGPHTAPAAAPCWTDASAHASPHCSCTCPAAIRRDRVSTPHPARGGGRKAKGAGGPVLHVHPAHQEKQVR